MNNESKSGCILCERREFLKQMGLLMGGLSVHTGVVTGNDPDDRACRTKIVAEVTGDYEKIYT